VSDEQPVADEGGSGYGEQVVGGFEQFHDGGAVFWPRVILAVALVVL
jgi:hypothetical protein